VPLEISVHKRKTIAKTKLPFKRNIKLLIIINSINPEIINFFLLVLLQNNPTGTSINIPVTEASESISPI